MNRLLRSWKPEKYILLRNLSEFNTLFFPSTIPGLYDAAILHHDPKLSHKYDPKIKFLYTDEMVDMNKLKNDKNYQFQILKQ